MERRKMKIYIDGILTEEHEIVSGYLMRNDTAPYITLHHGVLVVFQCNPSISINGKIHKYNGTALMQSGIITISTHF